MSEVKASWEGPFLPSLQDETSNEGTHDGLLHKVSFLLYCEELDGPEKGRWVGVAMQ